MDSLERLKQATVPEERIALASDPECSIEVLGIMIREDVEESVIRAAAANPNCTPELKNLAAWRFSQNKTPVMEAICPIPWTHIAVQQNGDYRICCQAIYAPYGKLITDGAALNVKNATIDQARNHPEYKNIRAQMLAGVKPSTCNLCYKEESMGLNSKRQFMLKKYDVLSYEQKTDPSGTIDTESFPLRYIDIRFGNLCNLKCRYCGPTDSSLWYEDFPQYAGRQTFNFYGTKNYELEADGKRWVLNNLDFEWYEDEKFWSTMKKLIPHIDRYYFTGGEPTINKAHFNLLQLIIDSGHAGGVTLEYNSNMVAIPDKLYDLWEKFIRVDIGCSIDGYGDYANYLRYPSKWSDLEANLDKLGHHGGPIIGGIATTVNVYNVVNFLDISRWLIQKNYPSIKRVPSYHVLEGPSAMSIQVLPAHIKEWVKSQYEKFYCEIDEIAGKRWGDIYRSSFSGIINYMTASDQSGLLPQLARDTYRLDRIRGQQLGQVIPWLDNILQTYKDSSQ